VKDSQTRNVPDPDDPVEAGRALLAQIEAAESAPATFALLSAIPAQAAAIEALAWAYGAFPAEVERVFYVAGKRGAGRSLKQAADAVLKLVKAKRKTMPKGTARRKPDDEIDIPPPFVLPHGYRVLASGVYREAEKMGFHGPEIELVRVCHQPLVLTGLSRDLDGGPAYVRLRWWARDAWHDLDVPRADALARSRLADAVVNAGLVVSSESSGAVVGYLEAALAQADQLPEAATSRVMGWRPGGFLAGSTWYPSEPGGADVRLAESDPGLRQLAEGYQTAGTWEGWCDLLRAAARWPRVILAVLGSLAAPLIHRIGAEASNVLIDFAGETSQGKTTTLRVAASVWGMPSERGGLVLTWDLTRTSLERIAAAQCDLPVLLDDTKRAKADQVGPMVYQIANGRGRGRGTVTGMQASAEWRTVLLSTGEQPLTSFTQDAGAAARCLTLWGTPIPEGNEDDARDLNRRAYDHHGHAGARLIQWLVANPPDRIRAWYAEGLAHAQKQTRGNAVAARASGYLALLWAAYCVALEIGVPDPGTAWWADAIEAVRTAAARSDNPRRALDSIAAWCSANAHRFYGRDAFDKGPAGETAGRWSDAEMWQEICLLPDVAKRELERLSYDADACIRAWADRGWLRRDGTHLGPKVGLPGRGSPRMLVIQRSAIEGEGREL
jgi:hypothetical protein